MSTGLTRRELEVLRLKAAGYQSKKIARELDISYHTVKYHVGNILRALKVSAVIAAVVVAARDGDIDLESIEILRRS